MVKKLKAMADKKTAAGAGLFDSALADSIKESAKQIWLAGMGAFAKAQAEGSRSSRRWSRKAARCRRRRKAPPKTRSARSPAR